ncbi:MAG: aquaporin [Verrucomicrobia bacterium]|nr:aquaporin [Verrucomicrobiota bacterium]
MKKYIVELIGTFFLVFTIGMSVRGGAALPPVAIGGILMVMIFAGGHVSGGHFNPAVSLAAFLRGALSKADLLPYWFAQLAGALIAGLIVVAIHGKPVLGPVSFALVPSLVVEFLATFALAWTVLNVATSKGTANNSFYGLAIGGTVMAMAFAVGSVSGGAFNPAVGFALPLMGLVENGQCLVYLAADLAGGAAAGLAFNALVRSSETSA